MRLKKYLLVLLASVLSGFAATVTADDWPSKPVRIIVSFPPGGSSDLVARLIGQQLSEKYGQQFIVDNRPGAGGTVAGELLKQQSGDGYTFMLSNLAPFTIAPTQFETIPYDPLADFTHASYIGAVHMGIIVSPELGVTDLAGLVAKAKAEPGMLNYGSSGVGSSATRLARKRDTVVCLPVPDGPSRYRL